jgi:hypothetical protein
MLGRAAGSDWSRTEGEDAKAEREGFLLERTVSLMHRARPRLHRARLRLHRATLRLSEPARFFLDPGTLSLAHRSETSERDIDDCTGIPRSDSLAWHACRREPTRATAANPNFSAESSSGSRSRSAPAPTHSRLVSAPIRSRRVRKRVAVNRRRPVQRARADHGRERSGFSADRGWVRPVMRGATNACGAHRRIKFGSLTRICWISWSSDRPPGVVLVWKRSE